MFYLFYFHGERIILNLESFKISVDIAKKKNITDSILQYIWVCTMIKFFWEHVKKNAKEKQIKYLWT